jgi:hypothetical protein
MNLRGEDSFLEFISFFVTLAFLGARPQISDRLWLLGKQDSMALVWLHLMKCEKFWFSSTDRRFVASFASFATKTERLQKSFRRSLFVVPLGTIYLLKENLLYTGLRTTPAFT